MKTLILRIKKLDPRAKIILVQTNGGTIKMEGSYRSAFFEKLRLKEGDELSFKVEKIKKKK